MRHGGNLDDNIGRLTGAIRALRLDKDTILVLISGHGGLFCAHGRRAKNIFYDEAMLVPFLVRRPVLFAQGEEQDVCLNTVDVMPTLLGRMGLKVLSDVEGANLSRYPRDKNKTTQDDCLIMDTGPRAVFGSGCEWRAYRAKRHTYAACKRDGTEFLFDDTADPYQMNDLSEYPACAAARPPLATNCNGSPVMGPIG